MDRGDLNDRLSRISTIWTLLHEIHADGACADAAARQLLVERYAGAARRYLHKLVADPSAADDLVQEFALALLRGEFHKADPEKGRFRDYLKKSLVYLVRRHFKQERRQPQTLAGEADLDDVEEGYERPFDESWREELLARTWSAMRDVGRAYHEALRLAVEREDLDSDQRAALLGQHLGREVTGASYRQTLHRARERFGLLLLDEVARSLRTPTLEAIEDELRDLHLLEYCRPALEQRQQSD